MMQQAVWICCVALFCLAGIVSSLVRVNSFCSVTDCVCPQDVVTFECTVCGLATAWEGTALDSCSGREIALTNRDFIEPIQTIICNGGAISARGISVEDGCFTSQLNITFNGTFQDTTVSCSVDNGTHASEVGRDVLALSRDSYPALVLEGVYLAEVSPTGLLFSWNQTLNCPSLRYNISSDSCGNCPNTTDSTSVNCSDFTLSNSITLCTFAVQAIICGNNGTPLIGNFSDSVTVNLTVPAIGQVTTIPHYHIDNGLRGLTVTFSAVDPFIISEDIDGVIISYIVYYSDSNTGAICGTSKINSSFCDSGICIKEFNVTSLSCRPSSDINVTVSAVTNLGEGPSTIPIMEEYQNNFVRVQVISESVSINCTFLNELEGTHKSCNATITYGQTCQDQMPLNGMRDNENDLLIVISLRRFLEDIMPSKYCGFTVSATANTRTVTVEGNLLAISFSNSGNNRDVIAGVVALVVILLVVIILIVVTFSITFIIYRKRHRMSVDITDIISLKSMDPSKPKIIRVPRECNMIDFATEEIENYDPDSGRGYYQFVKGAEEYISPKTRVVLVSEDEQQMCTGHKARKIIGVSDKREKVKLPDLSNSGWKYVFIQSTSRIRTLLEGMFFMYCDKFSDEAEPWKDEDKSLKLVDDKYKTLTQVPGDRKYPMTILEFAKTIKGVFNYNPGLGYGFYEFTKPELISYDKQVILMDKNEKLYYGPGARYEIGIGVGKKYDEAEEIKPNFDRKMWKRVFVQTRSNVRKLQPGSWFLYCNVASSEVIRVLEPYRIAPVPAVSEDGCKSIKFAKKNIPYYNPRAGYVYYEYTKRGYVLPERNIIARKKNGELFTGPGIRQLLGAAEDYDGTEEIDPPRFGTDQEWDCLFIQGKAYGRLLEPNTRFLYCEYDYSPKVY